jgi:hypothetical protein
MTRDREQILENRRKLRTQYGDLFDSIAGILFRHDPAGVNFEINPENMRTKQRKSCHAYVIANLLRTYAESSMKNLSVRLTR